MSYYKKIEGKNLYLASIDCNKDADKYREWVNCSNKDSRIVFEGYTGKRLETLEESKEELDDLAVKNAFAIVDRGSDELIGLIGLSNTQAMNQRSNLWIKMDTMMDYDKQIDQGVDALHLMLEYCFDIMNLHSIIIETPAFNRQLLDICENSKMSFMAERHQAVLLENDLYDNLISFQCTPAIYKMETGFLPTQDCSYSNIKNLVWNDSSNMRSFIEGKNIVLTNPKLIEDSQKEKYIPALAEFLNNPAISIPLGEYKTNWNDFSAREQLDSVDYVIEKDRQLLGYINLFRESKRNRSADLEVVIGNKKEQEKGYGREAMSLFLEENYQSGIYNSLVSNIFDFNEASMNLHESLGFQEIGSRYEAYYANGKLNDMTIYEMNQEIHSQKMKIKK